MKAGKLDRRIIIEQVVESTDGIGGTVETWSTFDTVWAEFVSQTGREFFAAKQINTALDQILRIRYRAGLNAKMRVKYGTRIFNIIAPPIDVNEAHVEIKLMCEELRG
jgi:SPP1 family predicted phage head-tail adaptor